MKSNRLELESEVIQISLFCHIICQILFLHRALSITKMLPFAYIVKKEKDFLYTFYSAKNTKSLQDKVILMLNGEYKNFCNSLDYILKSIHLLLANGNIELENDILFFKSREGYEKKIYDEGSFLYKAIEGSKDVEDFQFLKEVVQNV